MSRAPGLLPKGLGDPFSVTGALRRGVTGRRVRARDLIRPYHGVRALRDPVTVLERARALATVLGDEAVFSHHTAAALLELPWAYADGGRLHVTMPRGATQICRPDVVGHRGNPSETVLVEQLRVTSLIVTWADLASRGQLDDCVVLGDAVLARRPGSLPAMRREVDLRHGRRGVVTMRDALELVRGGESPMETLARLEMHRAGLPEPCLNRDISQDGGWLACPDFSWPRLRVAVEYDGDHHRTDRAQWQRDIARRRLLEAAGWRVIVITADDVLRRPGQMVALIRAALDAAQPSPSTDPAPR